MTTMKTASTNDSDDALKSVIADAIIKHWNGFNSGGISDSGMAHACCPNNKKELTVTKRRISKKTRTYVAIIRDHSASMLSLASYARDDYNAVIDAMKTQGQDILVSTIVCGTSALTSAGRRAVNDVGVDLINKPIAEVACLDRYYTPGRSTPLFDSVIAAIDTIEANRTVKDAKDKNVAHLVQVLTDGKDNASRTSPAELTRRIQALQATDRWSFAFRVPRGYKNALVARGIPEGNIVEMEFNPVDFEISSINTVQATASYFSGRTRGLTATKSFFVSDDNLSRRNVNQAMSDVTAEFNRYPVTSINAAPIRAFVEKVTGQPYRLGSVYYELTKSETIQGQKEVVVYDKESKHLYKGVTARKLLGLPDGSVNVKIGTFAQYKIFIQSTSVNRKLVAGTTVLVDNGGV